MTGKMLSPESQSNVETLMSFVDDWLCIARRPDKAEFAVFTPGLKKLAGQLLKNGHPMTQFLYQSEFKESGDQHARLAILVLKLLRAMFGELARDDWLKAIDRCDGKRTYDEPRFAEEWNHDRFQKMGARDRANALKAQFGTTPEALELKARRMRKKGIPMAGARTRDLGKKK